MWGAHCADRRKLRLPVNQDCKDTHLRHCFQQPSHVVRTMWCTLLLLVCMCMYVYVCALYLHTCMHCMCSCYHRYAKIFFYFSKSMADLTMSFWWASARASEDDFTSDLDSMRSRRKRMSGCICMLLMMKTCRTQATGARAKPTHMHKPTHAYICLKWVDIPNVSKIVGIMKVTSRVRLVEAACSTS